MKGTKIARATLATAMVEDGYPKIGGTFPGPDGKEWRVVDIQVEESWDRGPVWSEVAIGLDPIEGAAQ